MSDTTKNGMDYGLSRDRFDTEEEFEEALALAESLAENGHWYGIVPEDFASFDQYRERFLPLEEMWNHLAGLFYVYPKDFGSFGEFVKAFFEAGRDRMDAVARYLGLPEDSVSSAESFLAACGEMPTEQIRQFIREKAETDEEAAPSGRSSAWTAAGTSISASTWRTWPGPASGRRTWGCITA